MSVNREYKNSVFSWLFSKPETLRELYGALSGLSIDPTVPIIINTLEGVLFKARMNDISFEIGRKLVILLEHQSTINENMPNNRDFLLRAPLAPLHAKNPQVQQAAGTYGEGVQY